MESQPQSGRSATTKEQQKHYAALAKELQHIDANIKRLHANFQETSNLSSAFRKLETVHSSMFMAASTVFKESNN